jgi:hypothetical protein
MIRQISISSSMARLNAIAARLYIKPNPKGKIRKMGRSFILNPPDQDF